MDSLFNNEPSIERLTRIYSRRQISFDEYADNIVLRLLGYPKEVAKCLAPVDITVRRSIAAFAHELVESSDFVPAATVFMVDSSDPSEVERKRRELLPQYIDLVAFLDSVC